VIHFKILENSTVKFIGFTSWFFFSP